VTRVLVDTCVWSLALRRARPAEHPATTVLRDLALSGDAAIIGPIRQELLSGVRLPEDFRRLRAALRAYPDIELDTDDFERAATLCNACRKHRVQGSSTDLLICAVSIRWKLSILTIDRDFSRFAEILPIRLAT